MMKKNKCARKARTASNQRAKGGIPPGETNDFTLWHRSQTAGFRGHVLWLTRFPLRAGGGVGTSYFGPSYDEI